MPQDRISNIGHYFPPRYTCYHCYKDIEDAKEGIVRCKHCGTILLLEQETIPEFITRGPDDFELSEWEDEHGPV